MTQSTIFLSTPSARRATVGEVPFTYLVLEFLSTPSARRATGAIHGGETFQWNFYPRPPRGGRRRGLIPWAAIPYFYPRPPRGGRPVKRAVWAALMAISIHALREEGDRQACRLGRAHGYFYPRPPRGGRQNHRRACGTGSLFLSTPSARRATCFVTIPRRGAGGFLSTPSARRATKRIDYWSNKVTISIHALREEGDRQSVAGGSDAIDFYPRPPRGGRRCQTCQLFGGVRFLSTPSARRATSAHRHPHR